MIKYAPLFLLVFTFLSLNAKAQEDPLDSIQSEKVFVDLDEALKNPERVYKLDLSNQTLKLSLPDTIWSNFTNLQYLSLKNDHLKQLPPGLGYLENLKVLDLSGNDFKVLPSTFTNLKNLQELFLNDDKYFNLKKNIPTLSALPNLKSLHIESDGLKSLPKEINKLSLLEALYLNNNQFKEIPTELKGLENLKYLDLSNNKFKLPIQSTDNENFGFQVRF